MKLILSPFLLWFCLELPAKPLSEHIEFLSGEEYTFSQIQERARKENKIIFVDFWASWCGPCKQMESQVFTQKEVADKFNNTFINYKVDIDKSPGREMRSQYRVSAFPTYIFFKPDGEVLLRIEGMTTANFLLEDSEGVLAGN